MTSSRTFLHDGAVAVSLAGALGLVFLADSTRTSSPIDPGIVAIESRSAPEPPAPSMRLAVTRREYDDMGGLLTKLGSGFAYTELPLEDLEDASKLVGYDVIFLTCGTVADSWAAGDVVGSGDRPGVGRVRINRQKMDRVREAIRAYVGRGGTLYASDWRLDLIHYCFPERFQDFEVVKGAAQTLTAEVVDPGLRDLLGPTVELRFDMPNWNPAQFSGDDATVYLRGSYRASDRRSNETAPLLVKVPFEQGTIIFTSFHNEKVNSDIETKLLKFLVFAAVTARESAQAQRTMISGGFKPQKQTMLSASPEAPSTTQTYVNRKRGRLCFALNFGNQGAHLKLTVRGPAGASFEKQGTSSFSVDVSDATPGDWTYTVTALKLPHQEFPFSLTVGND